MHTLLMLLLLWTLAPLPLALLLGAAMRWAVDGPRPPRTRTPRAARVTARPYPV